MWPQPDCASIAACCCGCSLVSFCSFIPDAPPPPPVLFCLLVLLSGICEVLCRTSTVKGLKLSTVKGFYEISELKFYIQYIKILIYMCRASKLIFMILVKTEIVY